MQFDREAGFPPLCAPPFAHGQISKGFFVLSFMINYKDVNFKEVDIEDFIWSRLSGNDLNQRGIKMPGHTFFRQFNRCGEGKAW